MHTRGSLGERATRERRDGRAGGTDARGRPDYQLSRITHVLMSHIVRLIRARPR